MKTVRIKPPRRQPLRSPWPKVASVLTRTVYSIRVSAIGMLQVSSVACICSRFLKGVPKKWARLYIYIYIYIYIHTYTCVYVCVCVRFLKGVPKKWARLWVSELLKGILMHNTNNTLIIIILCTIIIIRRRRMLMLIVITAIIVILVVCDRVLPCREKP